MMKPRAAISWSGGKDCCLALQRTWNDYDVVAMLTTFNEDGERSRSHGLQPAVIDAQAHRLSLERLSSRCTWDTYTDQYTKMVGDAASRGITHLIFGDIVGDKHREWNEAVCTEHGLTAVMPIWGEPTASLAREFLARGGEARFVTVRSPMLDDSWLGLSITEHTLVTLERLGVDPCGEFGEFHTVVTQCPLFSSALQLVAGERVMRGECWAIDFTPTAGS
jgi:uncharacterized protein (TIGR00290 family)